MKYILLAIISSLLTFVAIAATPKAKDGYIQNKHSKKTKNLIYDRMLMLHKISQDKKRPVCYHLDIPRRGVKGTFCVKWRDKGISK